MPPPWAAQIAHHTPPRTGLLTLTSRPNVSPASLHRPVAIAVRVSFMLIASEPALDASALQRQRLQAELDATKDIMTENARKMVQRGELLDHMEERAGESIEIEFAGHPSRARQSRLFSKSEE